MAPSPFPPLHQPLPAWPTLCQNCSGQHCVLCTSSRLPCPTHQASHTRCAWLLACLLPAKLLPVPQGISAFQHLNSVHTHNEWANMWIKERQTFKSSDFTFPQYMTVTAVQNVADANPTIWVLFSPISEPGMCLPSGLAHIPPSPHSGPHFPVGRNVSSHTAPLAFASCHHQHCLISQCRVWSGEPSDTSCSTSYLLSLSSLSLRLPICD